MSDHPTLEVKPTYLHSDDLWPMMISVSHTTVNAVRFYVPDGGTDIGMRKVGMKESLMRNMYEHLLLYENKLHEAGYTFVPHDWARLMSEAGVEIET